MIVHQPPENRNILLVDGRRTPTGTLSGALSDYEATELASACLKGLEQFVDPEDVQELILGSVLQGGQGQAPARQALLGAGWPDTIPAVAVNKVCGSGIKSVLLAVQGILSGALTLAVAGGAESMSNAPHMLPDMRTGVKMGDASCQDSAVHDGLWCSIEHEHMGFPAERIAESYNLTREEVDAFALSSQQRAVRATDEGWFDEYRVDLDGVELEYDEPVRPETTLDQLGKLSPAFSEDGIVTAGNAPGLNDGASAVIVGDRESLRLREAPETVFRIEGYSVVGGPPGELFERPAEAYEVLMQELGWEDSQVDRIEFNEAFSTQVLANCRRLGVDPERINRWGGAVALGHPIGMSGNRIVISLMHQLRRSGGERGIASICMGGGNGIALAIRQVPI